MITDYKIKLMNGWVNLNTLSPNHKYYYRIKKPSEIEMGLFGASLAFFNENDDLVYCTQHSVFAAYLPPFKGFLNVLWLETGAKAYFIEYQRNNSYVCILSFEENICYKKNIEYFDDLEEVMNQMKNSINIKELLKKMEFSKYYIYKNANLENFKENIFNRWYPRLNKFVFLRKFFKNIIP